MFDTTPRRSDDAPLSRVAFTSPVKLALEGLLELPAVRDGLRDLELALAGNEYLEFHVHSHTRDVLRLSVALALRDGVDGRELELLAVAATYHDFGYAGYEPPPSANEHIGASKAEEAMRRDPRWTEEEIGRVKAMIMDTKLDHATMVQPSGVSDPLSKYLLDADLHNLGTFRFRDNLYKVYNELYGTKVRTKEEFLAEGERATAFLESTKRLLGANSYRTDAAREWWGRVKEINAAETERIA